MSVPARSTVGARRETDVQPDVSGSTCTPRLCALGTLPHRHCVCGLAMASDAILCTLCLREGLDLDQVKVRVDADEWDGRIRPSARRQRRGSSNPARYHDLLVAILQLTRAQEAQA